MSNEKSIADIPKRRGRRPTGGRKAGFLVRLDPDLVAKVDALRDAEPDAPSVAEMVRRLIARA